MSLVVLVAVLLQIINVVTVLKAYNVSKMNEIETIPIRLFLNPLVHAEKIQVPQVYDIIFDDSFTTKTYDMKNK